LKDGISRNHLFHHADWRTYTPADGLPSLLTDRIEQDAEGFLWFTTVHGGVYRFDGEEFRAFTHRDGLPGDHATCLFRDSQERLWLANGGLSGAL